MNQDYSKKADNQKEISKDTPLVTAICALAAAGAVLVFGKLFDRVFKDK